MQNTPHLWKAIKKILASQKFSFFFRFWNPRKVYLTKIQTANLCIFHQYYRPEWPGVYVDVPCYAGWHHNLSWLETRQHGRVSQISTLHRCEVQSPWWEDEKSRSTPQKLFVLFFRYPRCEQLRGRCVHDTRTTTSPSGLGSQQRRSRSSSDSSLSLGQPRGSIATCKPVNKTKLFHSV